MSLAFKGLDDKPLIKEDYKPKIVSLWDMLRLNAQAFLNVCVKLGGVQGVLFTVKGFSVDPKDQHCKELSDQLGLSQLYVDLAALGLSFTKGATEELIAYLQNNPSAAPIESEFRISELIRTFRRELKDRFFFMIPSTHANYYDIPGTILGEEVVTNLPELREDAADAGDCYAFEKNTACVFHLMRVMETVVQRLAIKLKVTKKDGSPFDVKNEEWYQIELAIGRAIDPMSKGDTKDKYLASLASLSAVRAGWRNPTMHPKKTYTAEEAKVLIDSVKMFVQAFLALP